MKQTILSEVSGNLLFRYRFPCPRVADDDSAAGDLPTSGRIPAICELDGGVDRSFAELRAAWSNRGLYFWLKVTGKKQALWCRSTQQLDSDGLQIWIDSRDTHNVHRATRFCHWFLMLPSGGGGDHKKPMATMLKINRARENAPSLNQVPIRIESTIQKNGYTLSVFLPAGTITGWNPDEHPMMGFNYLVNDRELGTQSLSVGPQYPAAEDPSLWNTLALVGKS